MALKSRKKFINFFNENGGNSNFITSKNTLVYLNKNANDFEKENFDSMLKISNMYNIAKDIKDIDKYFPNNIDVKKAVLLKGEFSFNPYSYLNALKKSLNKIEFINEELIEVIKQNKKGVTIKCSSNNIYHCSRMIHCGGSKNVNMIFKDHIKNYMFYGVGTALLLKGPKCIYDRLNLTIRTVNRGGSQCGLHVVPYGDGRYYVGAGNYIASNHSQGHRLETIEYLYRTVKKEILGNKYIYNSEVEFLLGLRSKTLDGAPMLGPINEEKNIYLASGFNRVGLSLSLELAEMISETIISDDTKILPERWFPCRNPISFGKIEEACSYYASSRVANLLEHNLIENTKHAIRKNYDDLFNLAQRLNKKLTKKYNYDNSFVFHPESYRYLIEKN